MNCPICTTKSNEEIIQINNDVEDFKKRILANIDNVDISFEVGYCYKQAIPDMFHKDSYWVKCYYFLKGLAHYYGVECWR